MSESSQTIQPEAKPASSDLPLNFEPDSQEFSGHRSLILGPARRLARTWRLAKESFYDFQRFRTHSSTIKRGNNQEKLISLITMAYHSLEKGLSLESPRTSFGIRHVSTLINRIDAYIDAYGCDEHCRVAINVLRTYESFNLSKGVPMPGLTRAIDELEKHACYQGSICLNAGTKRVERDEFYKAAQRDLADFFESRSSVRQFADQSVELADIQSAVHMAQKAPCVCNRQSGKVTLINSPSDVQDALEIQGGAAGFKEGIQTVLVISSDITAFQSAGERYQGWIDGGLFAMSLIYALHSLGLVTCSLNWSKDKKTDIAFKSRFSVSQSESIIMLLAVGHPKESFEVANSWRRPQSEVLRIYSDNSR